MTKSLNQAKIDYTVNDLEKGQNAIDSETDLSISCDDDEIIVEKLTNAINHF